MIVRILAACVALAGCNAETSPSDQTGSVATNTEAQTEVSGTSSRSLKAADDPVGACIRRGIAYFKEIGSYPTLKSAPNSGRDADEVAAERCARTITAFP